MRYDVVGIVTNRADAIHFLTHHMPDIVLLDINLEGNKEGIEVARFIKESYNIPFIFITAYSDPDTFNSAGVMFPSAYIIKPVDQLTLKINIELAILKHKNALNLHKTNPVLSLIKSPKDITQVDFTHCTYINATENYIHIFFSNGEKCILRYTLSELENRLDSNFIRVHKSYIVHIKYISSVLSGKLNILGTWIPIGRVFKANLKEYLLE
jgi:two-component system response regulator LytT